MTSPVVSAHTWREAVISAIARGTRAFAIKLVTLGVLTAREGRKEAVEAVLGQRCPASRGWEGGSAHHTMVDTPQIGQPSGPAAPASYRPRSSSGRRRRSMRGTGPRGRRSPAEVVASELVLRCAVLWKKLKVQPVGRKSGCGRAEDHPTGSSRRVISPRRNVCVYSMHKEREEKLQG